MINLDWKQMGQRDVAKLQSRRGEALTEWALLMTICCIFAWWLMSQMGSFSSATTSVYNSLTGG